MKQNLYINVYLYKLPILYVNTIDRIHNNNYYLEYSRSISFYLITMFDRFTTCDISSC